MTGSKETAASAAPVTPPATPLKERLVSTGHELRLGKRSLEHTGLSLHLQEEHDIFLDGLMLVSLAIDLQTLCFDHGNELPCAHFLPTYAATAWYHQALVPELQKKPLRDVIVQAEAFALGEYRTALLQGSRLDAQAREHIAGQVARYSGLSAEYVLRSDLRLGEFRCFKELLRHRGQTVGRLDTRFPGLDRDDAGEKPEEDAAMSNLLGAYASGINRLLKETLKCDSDAPYLVHAPIWDKWTWTDFSNKYLNVGASRRRAMHSNAHMRVYVASGYCDLATPHAAGDYTVNHLGLRDEQGKKFAVSHLEAGHMRYIHQRSLERMAGEMRAFVSAT